MRLSQGYSQGVLSINDSLMLGRIVFMPNRVMRERWGQQANSDVTCMRQLFKGGGVLPEATTLMESPNC